MRLVLYCDESIDKGRHFSNFYGGALVREDYRTSIEKRLNKIKTENNLFGELKWTKITDQYLEKYVAFINEYFDLIEGSKIKIRIMFTQNIYKAKNLTSAQSDNSYSLLYYQFIKHAFGFQFCDPTIPKTVQVLLDDFPDKEEALSIFRDYIASLSKFTHFRYAKVSFNESDVTDVDSRDHVILQGLDIILGSMQFRLNDKHLDKPPGARIRGSRTRAKEKLYKHINKRICKIYNNFNIGVSTGIAGDMTNRWKHSYRHWVFLPSDYEIDTSISPKNSKI